MNELKIILVGSQVFHEVKLDAVVLGKMGMNGADV